MISYGINGLYAITPDIADTVQLCAMTQQILLAGVQYVQYRNKIADSILRLHQARALARLCKQHNVFFIINDHYDLAIEVDADGVHVGKEDIAICDARNYLGQNKIIGVSCYNQLELALEAERQGADYVAFGAFFHSKTKTNTVRASTDLLSEAKNKLGIPIVAIGGITLANAASLINHGSDSIAVSHGLYGAQNIRSVAKNFTQLFLKTDQTFSSSS
ncbi:thiamine phosphate synthase [Nitrosomonas sp. Nm132]|jgi:thiamine-phosphate pyrophosphorylase|uniref:thiamine phosphate synthase n=1 Tax=Nitrosomonas sp. Nm132 TaxID=1881053 RepID=UPI0008887FA4|nr:thiamine phosphate synthase [Nitrosomonas sp. Nm132]SDH50948.1 thiamine-phosphate pyrophosphorylase [Nitrosomonas sp. Nm132]